LPGKPDLSNKKKKFAIFVNGCFWHRHGCNKTSMPKTKTRFWKDKFDKTVLRDQKNYEQLKSLGWKTVIIWECEVMNSQIVKEKFNGIIKIEG
jgi:DNA mismatch endonuclease (patch repair protein)